MGLALEIFGPSALVAFVTSLVVALLGRRLLAPPAHQRVTFSAAMAIGYFAGYATLPRSWAALVPQQPWQWLPYLGVATAAVDAAIPFAGRYAAATRWVALLALTGLAGCLLTPRWVLFGLSWPCSIVILTTYLFCVTAGFNLLPPRLPPHLLIGLLTITAAVTAVSVAAAISTLFAQLAALAAAALAGCWISGFRTGKPTDGSLRGVAWIFAVSVGGIAFTACVEPEQPLVALLVLPVLPLAASPFAWRTIS